MGLSLFIGYVGSFENVPAFKFSDSFGCPRTDVWIWTETGDETWEEEQLGGSEAGTKRWCCCMLDVSITYIKQVHRLKVNKNPNPPPSDGEVQDRARHLVGPLIISVRILVT